MAPNVSMSSNIPRMITQVSTLSEATPASVAEGSVWTDEMGAASDQLFFVTSYSDFDKLAHGPCGTEAKHSIYIYRFHPSDGSLVLLNIFGDPKEVMNPAFTRFHPKLNVVYTCTEDIENNGQIFAYALAANGETRQIGKVDAGGTSTCYLEIDKNQKNLIAVNYWDSTLSVIPLSTETGTFTGPIKSMYDPKGGKQMCAAAKKDGGANHSCNDQSTIQQRQADPHSHALVIDPYVGNIAYVPDLGKDLIREFYYDKVVGKIEIELNSMPSGLCTGMPDGPRYFQFHPHYGIAYVVNELSSTVAVFSVNIPLIQEIAEAAKKKECMNRFKGRSTLTLIQSIKTIPAAFPAAMNTCGRIAVHRSGGFVIVSNRGHQSLAIFKINHKRGSRGELKAVGYFHTRGETPRHFKFDSSGQYLIVANQDSDSIAVFKFNLSSGDLMYTGNEYHVPSPNFVCCCPIHDDIDDEYTFGEREIVNERHVNFEIPIVSEENKISGEMKSRDLEAELTSARSEISELRKMLSSFSQGD